MASNVSPRTSENPVFKRVFSGSCHLTAVRAPLTVDSTSGWGPGFPPLASEESTASQRPFPLDSRRG